MAKKNVIHPITLAHGAFEKPGLDMPFTWLIPQPTGLFGTLTTFLIEGPKDPILVDPSATAEFMKADQGFIHQIFAQTLEEGLAKYGLKCGDIKTVICTHLHADHNINAPKVKQAKYIVQKKELDEARNPHPISLGPRAYQHQKEFDKILKWEIIDGDQEIDEGVKVIFTPGHTVGGQSVVVDTEAGPAVICGFCVIGKQFNPPPMIKEFLGWEVVPTNVHSDVRALYDNMLKVKKMAKILITPHGDEFVGVDTVPSKKNPLGRPGC